MAAQGMLLSVTTRDGDVIYPVSQFRRQDGQVEVKPELGAVPGQARRVRRVGCCCSRSHACPELGERTPMQQAIAPPTR